MVDKQGSISSNQAILIGCFPYFEAESGQALNQTPDTAPLIQLLIQQVLIQILIQAP